MARKSSASSACFLMLPETGSSAAVRDALEAVANDLGASTFQGPPNDLLVLFGRRFADTGRANLLVVDVTGRSAPMPPETITVRGSHRPGPDLRIPSGGGP